MYVHLSKYPELKEIYLVHSYADNILYWYDVIHIRTRNKQAQFVNKLIPGATFLNLSRALIYIGISLCGILFCIIQTNRFSPLL